MKKILSLACMLLFFSQAYSQKEYINHFLGAKSDEAARVLADKIASTGEGVYTFDRIIEKTGQHSHFNLCYRDPKGENLQELFIEFTILFIGGNKSKGIEGDSFYIISKVSGIGEDILPIWRTFFDKEASDEYVLKFTKHDVVVNVQGISYQYTLNIEPNQWTISGTFH